MPFIKSQELQRWYKADKAKCLSNLRESLRTKEIRPTDFSIRDLAEAFIVDRNGDPLGTEFTRALDPRYGGDTVAVMEAVDSAAFKSISGQLIYTAMMDEYEMYMAPVEGLYTNVPTRFNGERIPGVSGIGEQNEVVRELEEYPSVGIGADWVDTPETVKRGSKIEISKETLFFDRTNLIIDRASKVGMWLGLNKAKRIIDMVLGVTNTYKWMDTAYDTYQTTTPWININASNGLSTYANIDDALAMFNAITEPKTGEPIMVVPKQIVLNTGLSYTARNIFGASQVVVDPNANTGTAQTQMWIPNSVVTPALQIINSPIIDARYTAGSVTATNWYIGDFKRSFMYMENWPISVDPMPANSYEEWNRDVVAGWKTGERGVCAVKDPRYVQENTA